MSLQTLFYLWMFNTLYVITMRYLMYLCVKLWRCRYLYVIAVFVDGKRKKENKKKFCSHFAECSTRRNWKFPALPSVLQPTLGKLGKCPSFAECITPALGKAEIYPSYAECLRPALDRPGNNVPPLPSVDRSALGKEIPRLKIKNFLHRASLGTLGKEIPR